MVDEGLCMADRAADGWGSHALMQLRVPFYPGPQPWTSRPLLDVGQPEREAYVAAMAREVANRAEAYADVTVPALWVGGGVAGHRADDALGSLLEQVASTYRLEAGQAEVVLEVYPGMFTESTVELCRRGGVTRLFVDYGTCSAAEARELGRHGNPEAMEETRIVLEAMDEPPALSMGLLVGIPGQTERSGVESVEAALGFGACEVDLRLFKLDPDSPLAYDRIGRDDGWRAQALHRLPTTTQTTQIRAAMGARLAAEGFVECAPGIWALPGCGSRYQRLRSAGYDGLGFGLGAITRFDGTVTCNTRDFDAYLAADGDPEQCVAESYPAMG